MTETDRSVRATAVALEHEPLPAEQVVSGSPTTATAELGRIGGAEYGLWEITPGISTDIEVEEVFVVISGRASVEFPETGRRIDLAPGDVVRLTGGERTVWTVTETLRKLYVAA